MLNSNVISLNHRNPTPQDEEILNQVRMDCYDHDCRLLAQRVGVSYTTVTNFRSGRTKWPRPATLFPLLKALGYKIMVVKA